MSVPIVEGQTITLDIPSHAGVVLRRLAENGFDAFLVGGCVRDSIIGRGVQDWDIATSARPADTARLFDETILTGERFGTVVVVLPGKAKSADCDAPDAKVSVEVTAFRTDGEYKDGRRPDSVMPAAGISEDLSRRDFTMNALALSADGELTDPFGGVDDIKNRIIRCVGEPIKRFDEDALRMFRAYRFAAQLGFGIEPETLSAINTNSAKAKLISAERVCAELEKTLMSPMPETAGEMIKAGLLGKYLTVQTGDFAKLERLIQLSGLPKETLLRWCAFCAVLRSGGFIKSAEEFLRALRLSRNTVNTCSRALPALPELRGAGGTTAIKRLLRDTGTTAVRCAAAAHDVLNTGSLLQLVEDVITSGECYSLKTLAVSGRDIIELGCPAGAGLGGILDALLEHVIERPQDNTREKLTEIAKLLVG